jgi:hypothetical protein
MGRNTEKDALYTVSIPRDSELLRMLQDDAEGCNLSVAKLIVVRLKDWYTSSGNVSPRTATRPAMADQQPAADETPDEPAPDPAITETVDEAVVEQTYIDDNTSAALDAWL